MEKLDLYHEVRSLQQPVGLSEIITHSAQLHFTSANQIKTCQQTNN